MRRRRGDETRRGRGDETRRRRGNETQRGRGEDVATRRGVGGATVTSEPRRYILVGPAAHLMPLVQETRRRQRGNADAEGDYDDDVDVNASKPKRRDPDAPWRVFEGYDAYHVEAVSRQLLHLADLEAPKYGHAITGRSFARFDRG